MRLLLDTHVLYWYVEGDRNLALTQYAFQVLPILPNHTAKLSGLAFFPDHKDPFDQLLVAQAITENIAIVSADDKLDSYGVQRLW